MSTVSQTGSRHMSRIAWHSWSKVQSTIHDRALGTSHYSISAPVIKSK